VKIIDQDGKSKELLKRYRQLWDLNEHVKKDYKKEKPKFPSKKLVGNMNPEFVQKRTQRLEDYLNHIAKLPGTYISYII
jgi:hypothetical protein